MIFNSLNIDQFLTISLVHLFAVISPGPDFIIVLRQSIHNRYSGFITSLGIGCGILFHISYCILGVNFLLSNNSFLFHFIKISGALYLSYLGLTTFLYKSNLSTMKNNGINKDEALSTKKNDFFVGFFTNLLNPKATLFFISLFALVIDSSTSIYLQVFYGVWMSLVTALWFCLVSLLISSYYLNIVINKYFTLLNRFMGILLILISIKMIFI